VGEDELFWDIFRPWLAFVERGGDRFAEDAAPVAAARAGGLAAIEGISAATLRRRMATEGGFRGARGRAVLAEGLDLLSGTSDSVDAIAVRLGYSDARSFRRFVKAATGRTPWQIRQDPVTGGLVRSGALVRARIEAFARDMDLQLSTVPNLAGA